MNKESLTEEQRRIACAERTGYTYYGNAYESDAEKCAGKWFNNNDPAELVACPNPEHSTADALALVEWWNKQKGCLTLIKVTREETKVHLLKWLEIIADKKSPTF